MSIVITSNVTKHLFNIVPIVNNTVIYSLKYIKKVDLILNVLSPKTEENHQKQTPQKDIRKFLQVMDMFSTLVVVMISWVYAYVQNYPDVYMKCVQFFLYINYILVKIFFLFLRSMY